MDAEAAYLFRHALLRDVAYELQTPSQRRALHRLTLDLMEQIYGRPPVETGILTAVTPHPLDRFAGELVVHARRAEEPEPSRLRNYLVRAAYVAEAAYRHAEALDAWAQLEGLGQGGFWSVLAAFRRGFIQLRAGVLAEAEEALRRALAGVEGVKKDDEFGGEARRLKLLAWLDLVQTLMRIGETSAGMDELRELIRVARDWEESKVAAKATLVLAEATYRSGELEESEALVVEARRVCEEAGDQWGLFRASGQLGMISHSRGELEEACRLYARATELANQCGERRAAGVWLGNQASMLRAMGRPQEAREKLQQAWEIARETGDRHSQATWTTNLANMEKAAGNVAEAESLYRKSYAIAEEVGSRDLCSLALGNLGGLVGARGRLAEGERALKEALQLARAIGDSWLQGGWLCELATVYVANGRSDEARKAWVEGAPLLEAMDPALFAKARNELLRAGRDAGIDASDVVAP